MSSTISDIDSLEISLTEEDAFRGTDYDADGSTELGVLYQDEEDVVDWTPSIVKPLPFAHLFSLYSDCSSSKRAKRQDKHFSGAFYPSLKELYRIVRTLKETMCKLPPECVEKVLY